MRDDKREDDLIIGAWSWVINHMTSLYVILDLKTSLSKETIISIVYTIIYTNISEVDCCGKMSSCLAIIDNDNVRISL